LLALFVAALSLSGCGTERSHGALGAVTPARSGAQGLTKSHPESPASAPFDATDFVSGVTNTYFPLVPGTEYTYFDGTETDLVVVMRQSKRILGVATTVVHDRVFVNGSLTEDTFDWYAQDAAGNVWYFGEDSKELLDGEVVSTEGSWQAGVDGAMPGIVMLAEPQDGDAYAQEDAPGVAEDEAKVVSLDETVTVPYGTFTGCLETSETTHLDPGLHERKFYARGVGLVLELTPKGGRGRAELTGITSP
jgi:hypothetical protein